MEQGGAPAPHRTRGAKQSQLQPREARQLEDRMPAPQKQNLQILRSAVQQNDAARAGLPK